MNKTKQHTQCISCCLGKKGKAKTTYFGIKLMRSQVSYWAAEAHSACTFVSGGPLPLDVDAVDKHQQRLQQRRGATDEQHQPNAGDGRLLGSSDSKEPEPELLANGEPLPFDESAAAKHQKRLEQHAKHSQHQSQGHGEEEEQQHQPRTGDGRKLGSPDSKEPAPEGLPSGDLDLDAIDNHQRRLQEQEEQRR